MGIFNTTKYLINYLLRKGYHTPPPRKMSKIVWMDLEMSGLDFRKDKILEVACLITNNKLEVLAECPTVIIHQSDEVLNNMNDWCIKHHNDSGLVNEVRKSTIDEEQAQKILVDFMEQNDVEKLASPLGGSTIYMDRIFLQTQLPKVDEHLHYRNIDVSTVKELCKRWSPKTFRLAPKKRLAHRGLDDIKDSIAELKYYRPFMFNDPSKK